MMWLLILILLPYLYLLLKIYAGLIKIKPYQPFAVPEIFVSVIVACRNEEKNLPLLMSDIAAQKYNPDLFELIVVDDNSTDRSYEIASVFSEIKNLKVLRSTGNGKKKAIKTGAEACHGSLIVTTDADCRMGKDWLKTIVSFHGENKPEMIISQVKLEGGRGFFQRFQEIEFLSLQGITAGTVVAGNPVMCNGANLAFLKVAFREHADNLHNELVSGDDIFLLHSFKKESGKILWLESKNAAVRTQSSHTLNSFLCQRARWISKSGSYRDRFTQVLAIVTFAAILLEWFLLIAGIFNPVFFLVMLAVFILKSVPDFLILRNTAIRYEQKELLWFFLPGQLIYPFYIIAVLIFYLFTRPRYVKLFNQ